MFLGRSVGLFSSSLLCAVSSILRNVSRTSSVELERLLEVEGTEQEECSFEEMIVTMIQNNTTKY